MPNFSAVVVTSFQGDPRTTHVEIDGPTMCVIVRAHFPGGSGVAVKIEPEQADIIASAIQRAAARIRETWGDDAARAAFRAGEVTAATRRPRQEEETR